MPPLDLTHGKLLVLLWEMEKKDRNKGKDHNSKTQLYFRKFLKYINNNMGYMFRLALSHLQVLKM